MPFVNQLANWNPRANPVVHHETTVAHSVDLGGWCDNIGGRDHLRHTGHMLHERYEHPGMCSRVADLLVRQEHVVIGNDTLTVSGLTTVALCFVFMTGHDCCVTSSTTLTANRFAVTLNATTPVERDKAPSKDSLPLSTGVVDCQTTELRQRAR